MLARLRPGPDVETVQAPARVRNGNPYPRLRSNAEKFMRDVCGIVRCPEGQRIQWRVLETVMEPKDGDPESECFSGAYPVVVLNASIVRRGTLIPVRICPEILSVEPLDTYVVSGEDFSRWRTVTPAEFADVLRGSVRQDADY